jgi:ABC-2 type transport system ATP-binding protein
MLQRTGLAAALVADPELLILDEPMSGLDPVGRKEVRDIILAERSAGRTIFFSTHILSDVETLCDNVVILRKGEVVVSGRLNDLLKRDVKRSDVAVVGADASFSSWCEAQGHKVQRLASRVVVAVEGEQKLAPLLRHALDNNIAIVEIVPRHETLEDLFVREAIQGHSTPS